MKVLSDKENKLLERREIICIVENNGSTPKRCEIKKKIAKKFDVDEKLVIVNKVIHHFGNQNIKVFAKIYDSEESLNRYARPHMIKRNVVEEVKEEGSEETKAE